MTDGLKAPDEVLPRGFVLTNTIAALLMQAVYAAAVIIYSFGRALGRVRPQDFWTAIGFLLGLAAVVSLPWSLLAVWRLTRHGTPERSIKQIGRAVLESLEYEGSIDQHAEKRRVDEVLDRFDVAGDPCDQVAAARLVVFGEGEPLNVVVQRPPQVVPHPLAHAGGEI